MLCSDRLASWLELEEAKLLLAENRALSLGVGGFLEVQTGTAMQAQGYFLFYFRREVEFAKPWRMPFK